MFWCDGEYLELRGRVGDIEADDGRVLYLRVGMPVWCKDLNSRLESEITYLVFTDNKFDDIVHKPSLGECRNLGSE